MDESQQATNRATHDEQRAGSSTPSDRREPHQPPINPIPGPMQGLWGGHQGREL